MQLAFLPLHFTCVRELQSSPVAGRTAGCPLLASCIGAEPAVVPGQRLSLSARPVHSWSCLPSDSQRPQCTDAHSGKIDKNCRIVKIHADKENEKVSRSRGLKVFCESIIHHITCCFPSMDGVIFRSFEPVFHRFFFSSDVTSIPAETTSQGAAAYTSRGQNIPAMVGAQYNGMDQRMINETLHIKTVMYNSRGKLLTLGFRNFSIGMIGQTQIRF